MLEYGQTYLETMWWKIFLPFLIYRSYVQELASTFDLDYVVNYNTSTMYWITSISSL